ncbi:MAG: hypothetical protein LQ349_005591 [Xanthoria aureola]|nr:MAG: hypothetical protein LQ349_005591 [Xanthoria aureola]
MQLQHGASSLVIVATFFALCCQTLPTSSDSTNTQHNSPAAPILKARAPDNPYTCYESRAALSRRARYNHCARAVALLPNLVETRVIHQGGDPNLDPYSLPVIKKFSSCQIKISTRFGRDEMSSWVGINVAMMKIVSACAVGEGVSETTGGEIFAGNGGYLVMTVERVRPEAFWIGIGQNGTGTAAQ